MQRLPRLAEGARAVVEDLDGRGTAAAAAAAVAKGAAAAAAANAPSRSCRRRRRLADAVAAMAAAAAFTAAAADKQDVLGLYVAVRDAARVAVREEREQLARDARGLALREVLAADGSGVFVIVLGPT